MFQSIMPRTNFANLSYELISKIVKFGTGDGTDAATGAIVPPSATGLLAATHVCRSWREAIVHNATHWRNIWMGSLDSVRTILARTLRLPVAVAGSLSTEADGRKLAVVMNQISRVRTLSLKTTSEALRALDGRREGAAAVLETLDIERVDRDERIDLSCFASPKLKRLDVTNFDFDEFRVLLSPSITSLRIAGACVSTTTGEVLQLLHQLPNLETLELKVNLIPTVKEDALVHTTCLERLRRLDMAIQSVGEAELLAFVSMPHIEFMRLSLFCDDDLPEIMELVRRRWEEDNRTEFGGCTFYAPNPTSLHVALTADVATPDCPPQVGTYLMKFGPTPAAPWISAIEHLSIRNARARTEVSAQCWKARNMSAIYGIDGRSLLSSSLSTWKISGSERRLGCPSKIKATFWIVVSGGINIFRADIEVLRQVSRDVHWDEVETLKARNDTFEEGVDFDLYDEDEEADIEEEELEDGELENEEFEDSALEDGELEDSELEGDELEGDELEEGELGDDVELEDGELDDREESPIEDKRGGEAPPLPGKESDEVKPGRSREKPKDSPSSKPTGIPESNEK